LPNPAGALTSSRRPSSPVLNRSHSAVAARSRQAAEVGETPVQA
jgi:hypothetical protein